MPIQMLGYLALGFSVFHKDVNLMSFFSAKVLIGHGYFELPARKLWLLKHP
jgi:hypothetical protein